MPPPDVCGGLRVSRGLWGPRKSADWERSGLAPPCLRGRLREAAGFLRLRLLFLRLGDACSGRACLGVGDHSRGSELQRARETRSGSCGRWEPRLLAVGAESESECTPVEMKPERVLNEDMEGGNLWGKRPES